MYPTDEQIRDLHKKYAKTDVDFDLIYTHCQVVEAIAMQLLDMRPQPDIDRDLVHVGCMLHDIGAYEVLVDRKFVQGVRHGVIGEEILKNEGYPEKIWRLSSHHTGVGLSKQDVKDQNIPIPVADYQAETDEERLIMYADKFHTKSNPPVDPPNFTSFESFRKSIQQFGPDKAAKFDELAKQFGKPDLEPLAKKFNYEIKE